MARRPNHFDNIFASGERDNLLIEAVNAQSRMSLIPNPYIGNKRKMLADIARIVYDNLPYNDIRSVTDLFAGSFVVGTFFRHLGRKVYFNELLHSSYLNGFALNYGAPGVITADEWKYLVSNKNRKNDNFVESRYVNARFTKEEAEFIDNFYANAEELFILHRDIRRAVAHSTMMQFIMTHCFVGGRLNSGQVIASLEHRLQHQRNDNSEMNFKLMTPAGYKFNGPSPEIFNCDAFDLFKQPEYVKTDLIYIDPPYGGQQSDYAFMYKFFEEYLARKPFDEIKYLEVASKRFAKAKTYSESFENLLIVLPKEPYWVFSYNDSSWANKDTISDMVRKHKPNVVVEEINYDYKYRAGENSSGVEYLIIGK
jgi:adenine-specific DNA-methyltransferase